LFHFFETGLFVSLSKYMHTTIVITISEAISAKSRKNNIFVDHFWGNRKFLFFYEEKHFKRNRLQESAPLLTDKRSTFMRKLLKYTY